MRKKRRAPIAIMIVEIFLVALFVFLTVWWFGLKHPDFGSAEESVKIPGLSSGISPQGLCVLPENEEGYDFAMSGYLKGPSRVYLIDEQQDGAEKYVTFTLNGKAVETHFGGVTCTENYMLVASGSRIIRIALQDVFAAQNGEAIAVYDSYETGLQNAFCYVYGEKLYAGEFYRSGNYETAKEHHLSVSNGTEINRAFVYVFDLDEQSEGGVTDTVPSKILSVRDQIQGIAVTDERIYLSESYGLPDSHLYVYRNTTGGENSSTFQIDGRAVPVYFLENSNLISTHTLPCMSEEICVKDGNLYILFESLSNKYRYFVRTRLSHVYRMSLSDLG